MLRTFAVILSVGLIVAGCAGMSVPTEPASPDHLPSFVPTKRSDSVAFHYGGVPLTDEDIQWYSNFAGVVLTRALPKEQVDALHKAGTKLLFYEFGVGFYSELQFNIVPHDDPDIEKSWQKRLPIEHPDWVLNADSPSWHWGKARARDAYYYDMAVPELIEFRAQDLTRMLRQTGYDGVFFDLAGYGSLGQMAKKDRERLQAEFEKRHPEANYNEGIGKFYRRLRELTPSVLLFPNHGAGLGETARSLMNYNLVESMMRSRQFAPVKKIKVHIEGEGLVDAVEVGYVATAWTLGAAKKAQAAKRLHNPDLGVVHLNYCAPYLEPTGALTTGTTPQPIYRRAKDRQGIHYAEAMARVVGQLQHFCHGMSRANPAEWESDPVYLIDLGKPLADAHEKIGRAFVRFYENGFAIVNPTSKEITVDITDRLPAGVTRLWNAFTEDFVTDYDKGLTIPHGFYPASGMKTPAGRIFVYPRGG